MSNPKFNRNDYIGNSNINIYFKRNLKKKMTIVHLNIKNIKKSKQILVVLMVIKTHISKQV